MLCLVVACRTRLGGQGQDPEPPFGPGRRIQPRRPLLLQRPHQLTAGPDAQIHRFHLDAEVRHLLTKREETDVTHYTFSFNSTFFICTLQPPCPPFFSLPISHVFYVFFSHFSLQTKAFPSSGMLVFAFVKYYSQQKKILVIL